MRVVTLFVFIALFSNSNASVQTIVPAEDQFVAWTKATSGDLNNNSYLFNYHVATLLKRIDQNHVQIKLAAVGRVSSYYLSFQPIKTVRLGDPETEYEVAGKACGWAVATSYKESQVGQMIKSFDEIIAVEPEADALQITVHPVAFTGKPKEVEDIKLIVEIPEAWSFKETVEFIPLPKISS